MEIQFQFEIRNPSTTYTIELRDEDSIIWNETLKKLRSMSVNVAKGSSVAITLASFWPHALNTTKYPKTSSTRVLNTGLFSASCGKKDQGCTINWYERSLAWKTLSKCAERVEHPQYFENWMNKKGAYLKIMNKLRSM